jgi:antitoxin MazE
MKTQIAKWGNSLAVRIPKAVADAAELRPGDKLDVDAEGSGAVVIRKETRGPSLKELVRGITDENRHSEIDTGSPVGNEQW